MSTTERNFPATLQAGDLAVSILELVLIPGYSDPSIPEDPADADSYRVIVSLVEGDPAPAEFPGVITGEFVRFDVPTTGFAPGAWHWAIEGSWLRGGVTRVLTFKRGFFEILTNGEAGVGAVSHASSMLFILRQIMKERLEGSGDLASYTIGERQISMIPITELHHMLRRYENDIVRLKGGPCFVKGTSVNTAE